MGLTVVASWVCSLRHGQDGARNSNWECRFADEMPLVQSSIVKLPSSVVIENRRKFRGWVLGTVSATVQHDLRSAKGDEYSSGDDLRPWLIRAA